MDDVEFAALYDIHNNRWPDTLLSTSLDYFRSMLLRHEINVYELKVQLYSEGLSEKQANEKIAKLLKIKLSRVNRIIYQIKSKLRHGMDTRVDNKLAPGMYYAKKWRIRKKELK